MKKNGFVFGLLAIGAFIALITACEQPTAPKSGEKAITAFVIGSKQAEINDPVITIALPQGTDVTNLAPLITVSEKASVSPASGVARDFSDSVTYTVTAEDGTTKDYIVIVTIGGDEPNDTRTLLVAGPDVYVDHTATTATATFTGAVGLTGLTAADFAVTGGASIYHLAISDTVTVGVRFEANIGVSAKIYTVRIAPASTKIRGSSTVTITQEFNDPSDTRTLLSAGSNVSVDYTATTATATFTGPAGLTGLTPADFVVTGGASIYNPTVNGNTVTIQVGFGANTDASVKTYIVSIAPTSTKIKGSSSVTITQQAFIDPSDTRTLLVAVQDVSVDYTDTRATATFTGAVGLTGLTAADFVVTAGGAVLGSPTVNSNTVTVEIYFSVNIDTSPKTYVVSIAPTSTKIKGSSTVTITQAFNDLGNPTYRISGTITGSDTGGAGLSGASVQLKNGGSVVTSVSTGADGTYTITDVPAGNYIIDVFLSGYTTGTIDAFAVLANVTGKNLILVKIPAPNVYTVNGIPGNDLNDMKSDIAAAVGGTSQANPIVVTITIANANLLWGSNGAASGDSLYRLFDAIPNGKYVAYDLSGSTFTSMVGSPSVGGWNTFRTNAAYLAAITLPDTLTSIGWGAFSGCSGLTSVTIPNSVTSIDSYAFAYCLGLTSVTIPDSVTSIDDHAFESCSGLTSVTVGNGVTFLGKAFWVCSSLTSVVINADYVVTNFKSIFDGHSGLSVTIGNSVTSIGDGAFSRFSGLTSVTIGNSVIGDNAFSECSGLTSVTIGSSVTSIGDGAFSGCSGLTSVIIPNSVTSIGDGAFSSCSNLSAIQVNVSNSAYTAIDGILFSKSGTELIAYPAGKGSTAYTIGSSVTSIGDSAFSGCIGLTSVTIGNSVTSIGDSAFSGCRGLASVVINADYVVTNFKSIFDGRSGLSVTIGNSVTSIGDGAFSGFSGLTSVTIGSSVTSISTSAFSGCSGLASVVINADYVVTNFKSIFDGHSGLSVTIGNSVTSIGDGAFSGFSGLTSVTIGNSVTSIGDRAFSGCSGLFRVYILRATTPLTTLGSSAFDFTASSLRIYVPASVETAYKGMSWWSTYASSIQAGTP
ncbi:hypothetical protein FACS189450_02630 [Spirochaetia bacterium]|nr:hypothetical protein FACS189450_02630 [Spirochaetia bacterium]